MPGVGLPVPRPADEAEFFEEFFAILGIPGQFSVCQFLKSSARQGTEEFGLTPFGSQQTYRIESPYFNTG